MTPRKTSEVIEVIRKREGLGPKSVEAYVYGMYTLDREVDMEDTRRRILKRWAEGIDRPMLREYRVLYYALGQLLGMVGEA